MSWLVQLFQEPHSAAHALLILSLAVAGGLALGSLRLFSINLGVAGVLFAGLALGHFKFAIEPSVLEFVREFGLILFVYSIGMQVGPGFFASLRKQGLPLNLMAAGIVLLGAVTTLVIYYSFMDRGSLPAAVGLFSGATTNTPSLAAAQQALKDASNADPKVLSLPVLGYAVAYPFGVIGIIITMFVIRGVFRISPQKEAEMIAQMDGKPPKLSTINLEVQNPNLDGLPLERVPTLADSGVVVSRVMKNGQAVVGNANTVLHVGDVLLAVGLRERLEQLKVIVGTESRVDVRSIPSKITTRRIVVTKSAALGRTIQELAIGTRFNVRITRISRAEIELPPTHDVKLQFGDNLLAVGEDSAIRAVANELGDSPKKLNYPQIIPIFVGIALGVILGSWPVSLPGVPAPVKLGLAGGPLVVAILLSRLGNIGPLVWHMPISANFILREIGIVLFLSCVGLQSGNKFVETLTAGPGLQWVVYGAAITLVPLLLVALFARIFYKLNYLSLCGLLAGSMTDPPALAFATSMTSSEAPSVSYATVYPLVMLLRVVVAQAMVIFLFH
ncbi:MAG: putative transporter [Bacillota bacterium]